MQAAGVTETLTELLAELKALRADLAAREDPGLANLQQAFRERHARIKAEEEAEEQHEAYHRVNRHVFCGKDDMAAELCPACGRRYRKPKAELMHPGFGVCTCGGPHRPDCGWHDGGNNPG